MLGRILRKSSRVVQSTAVSSRGIASLVAAADPKALALAAPRQGVRMSYGELDSKGKALGLALKSYGFERGDVVVSELPNTVENLLLQVACSRLGVAVATAKNDDAVQTLQQGGISVKAAIISASSSAISASASTLPLPPIFFGAGNDSANVNTSAVSFEEMMGRTLAEEEDEDGVPLEKDFNLAHGYFGSAKPLSTKEVMEHGKKAMDRLSITSDDAVCVSITLCHAFGIGSAVSSALMAGATVVLPAVGGIRGCGVPAQRAEVTLSVLASEACTLLFADSHTLKALPEPDESMRSKLARLRGGVCKIGSGADFLEGVTSAVMGGEERELSFAGVQLLAMGKK